MVNPTERPKPQSSKDHSSKRSKPTRKKSNDHQQQRNDTSDKTEDKIVQKINQLTSLKEYKIREVVEDTEELGKTLVEQGLKTNQIRKFLDAVNRFKVQNGIDEDTFEAHKDELHILRYHLAYATQKQTKNNSSPVEPLKKVLEAAIKKSDRDLEDFKRLVQLIESIVAYHKAAGGKNQ